MRRLGELFGLVAAFAVGTWAGGWLGVVLVALAAPFVLRPMLPLRVGVGAGLAWLLLILSADRDGSLGRLTGRLGGIFGLPGWGVVLGAVAFAALLAWSAARVATGLRPGSPRPGPGR